MYSKDKINEIVRKTAELLSSADIGTEITTRKIAENAGINPAMVNYYFGSKDNLLKEAVSLMDGDRADALPETGSRKAMFDFLVNVCETSMLYAKFKLGGETASFTKDVLKTSSRLIELKKLYDGTMPDGKDIDSAFGAVCFLMTASSDPEGFAEYSGIDIRSKNQLRMFVSNRLDILLGDSL